MAEKKAEKKSDKTLQQKWKHYEVNADKIIRKNKLCPKCGPGVFMAQHKDRWACGKCGYMEKK